MFWSWGDYLVYQGQEEFWSGNEVEIEKSCCDVLLLTFMTGRKRLLNNSLQLEEFFFSTFLIHPRLNTLLDLKHLCSQHDQDFPEMAGNSFLSVNWGMEQKWRETCFRWTIRNWTETYWLLRFHKRKTCWQCLNERKKDIFSFCES